MKDSTVKDLDLLYTQARSAKKRYEPVWYMNMSYNEGFQWVAWNGNKLHEPALGKNRITYTDNRIGPCIRTEIAKLTRSAPVFTVTPKSGTDEDSNAAELAEKLMEYFWPHLNMPELDMKALEWSRICGAGFLKVFWDSSKGDSTEVCVGPDGQVLCDAEGKPVMASQFAPQQMQMMGVQSKQVSQGDIVIECRSPFQIFPDPLADSFPEIEWLVEESVKSTEYAKRRYGVELEADTTANPGLVQAMLGGGQGSQGSYKGVKIREYWCNPCSTHPQGRRAVWCKDKLLEEDGKPFDPMPYVMFSGIPIPGRLWPTSVAEQLRGPQTELNKVKSQIAENRNRVGNPTILASKQSISDPDRFTESMTLPGGVHYYDDTSSPNAVPTYLQAPPLPNYVLQEIDRIEKSIQEISGQHEVTSANVPPGVTAASAINLLQEADDTRIAPAVRDHETQLAKVGQKVLALAAKFYTDSRTIRIAGDNASWEIFDFRGIQLRDNTHVEVQAGSAFPHSKAAKQAAMQDLLNYMVQSGNPLHGKQLAQFLGAWEVGGADKLVDDYTKDEEQINRENQRLLRGEPLPINEYDNDQAHIEGHTDEQKSVRYENQPPPIQAMFAQHVQAHRDRIAAQQQAQMQMALPPGMPGSPLNGPGPPGPPAPPPMSPAASNGGQPQSQGVPQ